MPHLFQVVVLYRLPEYIFGVGSPLPELVALFNPSCSPRKIGFELVHTGIGKQQRWVILGHHRCTLYNEVFFLLKKFQKLFAGSEPTIFKDIKYLNV
jgi:hypothetical protein